MGERPRSSATHLSGYVIGRAAPGDIVEVARLERVCYSDPWADSAFESLPENPAVYFGVARQVGHGVSPILGYVVAWFVLDEGELANLAVDPRSRGRGVGRALLDAAVEEAERRGATALFLEVRESNAAALRLYSGESFERIGRRKAYYRQPVEDALVLRRRVDPRLT